MLKRLRMRSAQRFSASEFTANGVLMIAFGFLMRELRLSAWALKVWFAALQIGTWANVRRALPLRSLARPQSSCQHSMRSFHRPRARIAHSSQGCFRCAESQS
jgi:hypothetical protein